MDYDALNLQIAINYGSRDEIVRPTSLHGMWKRENSLPVSDQRGGCGTRRGRRILDLLIRTSGEERLSNFPLWAQLAYAEFYFTDAALARFP